MHKGIEVVADPMYGDLSPATPGSAAIDLRTMQDITIPPGETLVVNTGFAIHLGLMSLAGLVLPRSGLAAMGITLKNGIGLIDSDYQGSIKVALYNDNLVAQHFQKGERIAQFVIVNTFAPHPSNFVKVDKFSKSTERGDGGFGSTGVMA